MGASAIVLCPRCRRETLPQANGPSWHKDAHRGIRANDATRSSDPRAERIKARKAAKAALRAIVSNDVDAEAKVFALRTVATPEPSEDCDECQRIQKAVRARFLGYDPKTNRAYAQIIR